MVLITEYMLLPLEERQSHLDLSSPCSEIGGNSSIEFRGLLAYHLGTTIPSGQGRKIQLCHACGNDKCSSVKHLYWGTPKENHIDAVKHGTYSTIVERTARKYGDDFVRENAKKAARASVEARRAKKLIPR